MWPDLVKPFFAAEIKICSERVTKPERSPRRDDPPKNKELASCLASSRLLLLTF